jgi:PAS domain S-box-containing protein
MKTESLSNRTVHRAFGSAIVAVLIVSAISYRGMAVSGESDELVRHTHEVIENLQDLVLEMRRVESSDRGFLLTGDENNLRSYHDAVARAQQLETTIRNLTVDNVAQQRNITTLVRLADQKIQFAESVIELQRAKGMDVAADYLRTGDGERIMSEFQVAVQEMEVEELRLLRLRDADAKRRLLQAKVTLIIGTALGLLIAAGAGWSVKHDISRLRLAEEARRGSGAKYRGLLEAAPNAMVVVNQQGEIVLLNVQAEKQFGYRRDELIGQRMKNIIPAGFAERLIADGLRSVEDATAQQIGTGIELTALRKNGSEFPIELMLSPLESAAIRDITKRKVAEANLLYKVEDLNRSNEELGQFAYSSPSYSKPAYPKQSSPERAPNQPAPDHSSFRETFPLRSLNERIVFEAQNRGASVIRAKKWREKMLRVAEPAIFVRTVTAREIPA